MNRKSSLSQAEHCKKIIAVCFSAALVLSLLPLVWIGIYNYPCYDDFSFGTPMRSFFLMSGSFFKTLAYGVAYTINLTFDGVPGFPGFLNVFPPDIWQSALPFNANILTPVIMLSVFIAGNAILLRNVFRFLIPLQSRSAKIIFLCSVLFVSINFVPSPCEAFYWYIGASVYTLRYAFFMILCASLIKVRNVRWRGSMRYLQAALIFVSSAFLGFWQYLVPGFIIALGFLALVAYNVVRKKERFTVFNIGCVLYVVGFAGLVIDVMNDRLILGGGPALPALSAIFRSLLFVAMFIGRWLTNVPFLMLMLVCLSIIYPAIKKSTFSFHAPYLVTFASYCALAAANTPVVYANGGRGSGRTMNICYWLFIFAFLLNAAYWLGWLLKNTSLDRAVSSFAIGKTHRVIAAAMLCCTFALSLFSLDHFDLFDQNRSLEIDSRVACVSAAWSLVNGQAQSYAAEREERLEVLLDPHREDVQFSPIQNRPWMIFYTDLDFGDVASYYGKSSVSVTPGASAIPDV
ncbi:MAG: hypothetical protein RR998_05630 [Oscillospiraceae bacterium]